MATDKEASEKKGTEASARNQARRERVRFAGPRRRLQIDEKVKDKNFEYRYFNADNDELAMAERAGYTYVRKDEINDLDAIGDKELHGGNTDLNSMVSRVVGRDRAGAPLRAYLMKLPKELYEEDQRWREENVNALVDASIRRGQPRGAGAVENAYGLHVDYRKGQ